MELWQLRTFSVVARTLHFTRASEELNLTQPAVSHQIKSLENELGEKLFVRDGRGITLTREGRIVAEYTNRIFDITDEMKFEIEENKDAMRGEIKVGAVSRSLENPFPELYESFREKYEDIELYFQNENFAVDIFKKIRSGEIDVGFAMRAPESSDLVAVPYGSFRVLCVVGKTHRLARMKELTALELENEEWALFEPKHHLRKKIEQKFMEAGIAPKNIYSSNDGSVIRELVARGRKISLLPTRGISGDLREGKLQSILVKDLEFPMQIYIVWKAGRHSKIISAFVTFMLEKKLPGVSLVKAQKMK